MTALIGFVSSVLLLIAAVSERTFRLAQRDRLWPAPKMLWAAGTFVTSCGFVFLLAQGRVAPWLGIVVANSLLICGWGVLAIGMHVFIGSPRPSTLRMCVFMAVFVLLFVFLTFVRPSVSARTVCISVYSMCVYGECGVLSLKSSASVPGSMPRVSASAFFVFSAFFCFRAVITLIRPIASLFDSTPNLVTTSSFVVAAMSMVAMPILLILLRNAHLMAELEHGEAIYRGIVENAGVGIYQSTWEGRSLQVNAACAALFGYESAGAMHEAFGYSSLRFYANADDRERFLALMAEKGHVEDFRVESRRADGSLFWLSINATLVRGEGGSRILTGTLTDASARIREEEDLKRSRDEKSVRLRELQHRVKNGMSVIASLAALKAGQASDEPSRRAFEDLEMQIASLASLYDLLYRSGETMDIRLDEYLEGLIAALRTSHGAEERGIGVATSLDPVDIGLKRAEAVGLAVVELVSDSFKHAFPNARRGRIRVSLDREGDMAVLEIADDGIGLPEGFSLASTNGYGMTMVGMLAAQLGGSLEVGAGPGARFTLRFPFNPPEPRAATAAE